MGPVLGTVAFILIEEMLSQLTIYWQLPFGIMLILVVIYSKGGLTSMLAGLRAGSSKTTGGKS